MASCCGGVSRGVNFEERDSAWLAERIEANLDRWKALYETGRKHLDESRIASFKVGVVADDDEESRVKTSEAGETIFRSYLEKFQLTRNNDSYDIDVLGKVELETKIHDSSNRGAELSTLNWFNGKLYAGDDRTGALFEVLPEKEDPLERLQLKRYIPDYNGKSSDKGFKCEWAAIKDGKLYIGSHGRLDKRPELPTQRMRWVKVVDSDFNVKHLNWQSKYDKIARAVGLTKGLGTNGKLYGYLTHEGALWSDIHKRWFFAPRKVAYHKDYDFDQDPRDHSNLLISCTEDFDDFIVTNYNVEDREGHGCSDMMFVEGSGDTEIICTRTIELEDTVRTWLCVFEITGKVLLDEYPLTDGIKYEGVEALHE